MTAQILDRILTCYRIGDPNGAYPVFDATGSTIAPGRWNTSRSPMIYTSEHYSTALLEKLLHGSGRMPLNQHCVTVTIPSGLSYEVFPVATLPGWDRPIAKSSKAYGEKWCREKRSLVAIVPSVVARRDMNFLVNPAHAEFKHVSASLHEPVYWDSRLYGI
ncbi:hypothetical protein GCM10007874_45900 [Labrys miyagiensis]|uniref:RES domain-containing protein n=1 Tax=Labrys miyagiensis TaxID=346912 RepID=A0ABQ6CML8_9HYPH|nr:RES family NAD+ phosphorylase [Labrys miyagiensis]GLS21573.1 hypothetical protein GCM10007874_45900 [Labrys miyagiensis]